MADIPTTVSYLGTPIMSNVVFVAPLKEYRVDNSTFDNNDRIVLNDVMVTVSLAKNIVKTNLVQPQGYSNSPNQSGASGNRGYRGTVKEYISLQDYDIQLQGYITSEEIDVFPQDALENLLEYLNYPGNIRMYGKFIDLFSLSEVVVTNYRISEERGFSSQVPFTASLISDDPIQVKYEPAKGGAYVPFEGITPTLA